MYTEIALADGELSEHSTKSGLGGAMVPEDAGSAKRESWTRAWSLFVGGWIVFVAFPVYGFLQSQPEWGRLLVVLVGTMAFVALYLWLALQNPFTGGRVLATLRARRLLLAALTILALALAQAGIGPWLLIFVVVAAGAALPLRDALVVIALLTTLAAVLGSASAGTGLVVPLLLAHAGIGLGTIAVRRLVATIGELQAARKELARLAVAEERLRFARDLHDVVGHNLSLITLKSELAVRLAADAPERASQEMRDVEMTARESLSEVREVVAGYRQPTIETELEGAREMLGAAGMTCTIEGEAGVLSSAADATLAWAIREAVTNVIRHSHASGCVIRLHADKDFVSAEVIDDGPGIEGEEPEKGSGLAGVAERVAANGGSLEAGPLSEGGGFRLYVRLPLNMGTSLPEAADGASGSTA